MDDSFPFLKEAIERAKTGHNVLIIADSRMGGWLFTYLIRKELGYPNGVAYHRDILGYDIGTMPDEEARMNGPYVRRAIGRIFVIPRRKAKEWIGKRSDWNISDVFVWSTKGTERMSILDWQEKAGLKKRRPPRFERTVL